MTLAQIIQKVQDVTKKFQTRSPQDIANGLRILTRVTPLGAHEGACKGFFIVHKRQRHITVNGDLPPILQRIIWAHELGHALLHADALRATAYHDIELFSVANKDEYEANLFAAELLIEDEEILEAFAKDPEVDFIHLACALSVPPALLDFKLRILQHKGHPSLPPHVATGNFLKRYHV